jgi:hypothetical protein
MIDAHWQALTARLMPTLFVAVRSKECVARKDPALGRERSGTGEMELRSPRYLRPLHSRLSDRRNHEVCRQTNPQSGPVYSQRILIAIGCASAQTPQAACRTMP